MPFPLIAVGAALAVGTLVKGGRRFLRDREPRNGYCTWCGRHTRHAFSSDAHWTRELILVSSLLSRDTYRCVECRDLTLPCRMPGCDGMARSTRHYDEELCGRCLASNDMHANHARTQRAREEDFREKNALVEMLKQHEQRLRDMEAQFEKAHNATMRDEARLAEMLEMLKAMREERDRLRRKTDSLEQVRE